MCAFSQYGFFFIIIIPTQALLFPFSLFLPHSFPQVSPFFVSLYQLLPTKIGACEGVCVCVCVCEIFSFLIIYIFLCKIMFVSPLLLPVEPYNYDSRKL